MNIRVSYGEIEAAAVKLGAGRDEITAKLTQLQSDIEQLVSSGFVTEVASAKFNDAYQQYSTGARQVIEQLTEIQTYLTQTAQVLRDTDTQLAAKIG